MSEFFNPPKNVPSLSLAFPPILAYGAKEKNILRLSLLFKERRICETIVFSAVTMIPIFDWLYAYRVPHGKVDILNWL